MLNSSILQNCPRHWNLKISRSSQILEFMYSDNCNCLSHIYQMYKKNVIQPSRLWSCSQLALIFKILLINITRSSNGIQRNRVQSSCIFLFIFVNSKHQKLQRGKMGKEKQLKCGVTNVWIINEQVFAIIAREKFHNLLPVDVFVFVII